MKISSSKLQCYKIKKSVLNPINNWIQFKITVQGRHMNKNWKSRSNDNKQTFSILVFKIVRQIFWTLGLDHNTFIWNALHFFLILILWTHWVIITRTCFVLNALTLRICWARTRFYSEHLVNVIKLWVNSNSFDRARQKSNPTFVELNTTNRINFMLFARSTTLNLFLKN